jgi:hypothetical protein
MQSLLRRNGTKYKRKGKRVLSLTKKSREVLELDCGVLGAVSMRLLVTSLNLRNLTQTGDTWKSNLIQQKYRILAYLDSLYLSVPMSNRIE